MIKSRVERIITTIKGSEAEVDVHLKAIVTLHVILTGLGAIPKFAASEFKLEGDKLYEATMDPALVKLISQSLPLDETMTLYYDLPMHDGELTARCSITLENVFLVNLLKNRTDFIGTIALTLAKDKIGKLVDDLQSQLLPALKAEQSSSEQRGNTHVKARDHLLPEAVPPPGFSGSHVGPSHPIWSQVPPGARIDPISPLNPLGLHPPDMGNAPDDLRGILPDLPTRMRGDLRHRAKPFIHEVNHFHLP